MITGTLFVFCGKMASGKTTLAKEISQERSSILISEDALLEKLYPDQINDVSSYVHFSGKLKSAMKPILVELLHYGVSIVLDFPANTIDQRKWIKGIIDESKAHHVFHYLDSSNSLCKSQLNKRAFEEPERRATDTAEMFDAISRYFEPPTSDEGFEIVTHKRQ